HIRMAQLAQAALLSWHARHVVSLESERAFVLTAPVHKRVIAEGLTISAHVSESVVPSVVTSAPFRRIVRPGTALTKRLDLPPNSPAKVVARINAGDLMPAPPKVAPSGAISTGDAVKAVVPANEPPAIKDLLDKYPWLRFLPLLVLLIV